MNKKNLRSIVAVFMAFFFMASLAHAKRAKVNTRKLQEKYWTPQDYKTGVVQGRTFFKQKRFKLGLESMTLLNDKYSSSKFTKNFRGDLAYYVNERFAIGAMYEKLGLEDNTALEEMSKFNAGGFKLSHVKANSFYGGFIDFVPVYSKLSWMNQKIVYLDFMISPKAGMMSYTQQVFDGSGEEKTSPFVGVDLSTNIFLTNHISLNLAYRTRVYQAEVIDYGNKTLVEKDKINFNNFFTLGFNIYL